VSVVAVLTACAGMSEIVVSGECNHYILIYVSSGMKSNNLHGKNPFTVIVCVHFVFIIILTTELFAFVPTGVFSIPFSNAQIVFHV
jgi:hypothetical protein